MDDKLAKALDKCITRINRGESIESCLSDYPELANELRSLLRMSDLISKAPQVLPSESFRQQSKDHVLAEIRQPDVRRDKKDQRLAADSNPAASPLFGWKRALIPVVSVVAILIVALLVPGLWSTTNVMASPCTLSILSGNVELQDIDSDDWITGTDGSILDVGHHVRTAADSYAVLTFFDGSTMELEPGSTVTIEKIKYTKDKVTGIAVKQITGVTWNHILGGQNAGVSFQVITPAAEVAVRNTLFTVAVNESGATEVTVTRGNVTVSAQDQEVGLSDNQQTSVDVGTAPESPVVRADTTDKLFIAVELPGVCSVNAPDGLSTGYLPNGVSFNQIKDSFSELLSDGRQLITIPKLRDGLYLLVIRNASDQSVRLNIRAVSADGVVLNYKRDVGGTGSGNTLVCLDIDFTDGKFVAAQVVGVRPLAGDSPEKLVITRLAIERALSARAAIAAAVKPQVEDGTTDATIRPTDDPSGDNASDASDNLNDDTGDSSVSPADGTTSDSTSGTTTDGTNDSGTETKDNG